MDALIADMDAEGNWQVTREEWRQSCKYAPLVELLCLWLCSRDVLLYRVWFTGRTPG